MSTYSHESVVQIGRGKVVPFVHKLYALHFPEVHRVPVFASVPGSNDGTWVRTAERQVAVADTTIIQKAEAIGINFRHVGSAVTELHPVDRIQYLADFCIDAMSEGDIYDLTEMQGRGFELGEIMPPEHVLQAMFRHFF
jgi:hypothetical protein